jgi:hypothetical protein
MTFPLLRLRAGALNRITRFLSQLFGLSGERPGKERHYRRRNGREKRGDSSQGNPKPLPLPKFQRLHGDGLVEDYMRDG